MKKTEMSISEKYRKETGRATYDVDYPDLLSDSYVEWLEAKATAYDRLMSGGKKTPKEVANFLGKPIAKSVMGAWSWFDRQPVLMENHFGNGGDNGYIPDRLIKHAGRWQDSLTLPDGWEGK